MRDLECVSRTTRICLVGLVAALFASCSGASAGASYREPGGASITWTPPKPGIGDLVQAEVLVPGGVWSQEGAPRFMDADGKDIQPLDSLFTTDGVTIRYAFRLQKPGNWTWGANNRSLWNVLSVAEKQTALVEHPASDLWNLKVSPAVTAVPQSPAAQGGVAPVIPPASGGTP